MRIVALVAVLLAAACSEPASTSKGSNVTLYATPGARGEGPNFSLDPPQRTPVVAVHRARLVGRWGNPPNHCSNTLEFREDGTFIPGDGTRNGRWELGAEYLTITGQPTRDARRILQVASLDERRLVLIFPSGMQGELIRC